MISINMLNFFAMLVVIAMLALMIYFISYNSIGGGHDIGVIKMGIVLILAVIIFMPVLDVERVEEITINKDTKVSVVEDNESYLLIEKQLQEITTVKEIKIGKNTKVINQYANDISEISITKVFYSNILQQIIKSDINENYGYEIKKIEFR